MDWLRPVGLDAREIELPRTPDGRVDLVAVLRAGGFLLLESAPDTPATGRWSYVALGQDGFLGHDGHTTTLRGRNGATDMGADAFAAIDAVASAMGATPDGETPIEGPAFIGGLAGALSYDLARLVEDVGEQAAADRDVFWLDLRVVTDLVAIDHETETAWRVQRPLAASQHTDDATLVQRVREAAADPVRLRAKPPTEVTSSLSREQYLAALDRILEHIAAGDVFQINLAQRLSCRWRGGAMELYERLRAASPAPHGALFLPSPGQAVASISPESFLLASGRQVLTRPIKGTRPRHDDPAADLAARDELLASAKDRAENVMVVDMERNDLGRVCEPGTVRATDLLDAEAHPTVWQLVSSVEGRLRDDVGWGELLRATFPSGSVTGTPKVAAMQIIEELEPVRRSWYCGSLGWLGPGTASLSVAIRTAVLHRSVLDYAAGGGIVADSNPEAEIAESWAKAAAFLTALGLDPEDVA